MLSNRTTIKVDFNCYPAKLVLGTTLRLPAQFVSPSANFPDLDPSSYADRLQLVMQNLHPTSPRIQTPAHHVPEDLQNCSHVFLRTDSIHPSRQPPYDGPFKVLQQTPKHFTIPLHNKSSTVSIDRLTPACIEPNYIPPPPPVSNSSLPQRELLALAVTFAFQFALQAENVCLQPWKLY